MTADGQRFLMVKDQDESSAGTKIVVVLNWARTLAGKTGTSAAMTGVESRP